MKPGSKGLARKLSIAMAVAITLLTVTQPSLSSNANKSVVVTDGSINVEADKNTTVIRPFTTVSDSGTLTVGVTSTACGSGSTSVRRGYASVTGLSFGSYSPSTLTGGKKVAEVWDQYVAGSPAGCPPPAVVLAVSGFSASPGFSWVTSITCNSVSLTAVSTGFSYSSGVAMWVWPGKTFNFTSGNYTCKIVHNNP